MFGLFQEKSDLNQYSMVLETNVLPIELFSSTIRSYASISYASISYASICFITQSKSFDSLRIVYTKLRSVKRIRNGNL